MNKLNPIIEAMNNIDDSVIVSAEKTRAKPILLRVGISAAAAAAAAAAVFALAVGIRGFGGRGVNYIAPTDASGAASSRESSDSEISLPAPADSDEVNNSEPCYKVKAPDGKTYIINVYPQNLAVPEIYKPAKGEDAYFFDLEKSPTEVFAEFGLKPLISDCFTEKVKAEPSVITNVMLGEEVVWNHRPTVYIGMGAEDTTIEYMLHNKTLDKDVSFRADYHNEPINADGEVNGEPIMLRDGSYGFISRNNAFFAYNGVIYNVSVWDNKDSENKREETIQVLTDLGIL